MFSEWDRQFGEVFNSGLDRKSDIRLMGDCEHLTKSFGREVTGGLSTIDRQGTTVVNSIMSSFSTMSSASTISSSIL